MTTGVSKQQVVHFDFIALKPGSSPETVEELVAEARGLVRLPGVEAAGLIRPEPESASDFDLAFYFVLEEFTALEPFGTHEAYIRFLQGRVARILRAFAGADVVLRDPFPDLGPFAVCLALAAPDETYDWEVWAALDQWRGSDTAMIGLAVGERQRYRGCVLRFSETATVPPRPDDDRFTTSLIAGTVLRL